ncbi:hypothetical protein, partial [Moorena sp. SIO3I6]|uniref:hypothetical protein n=1 Tax=Moorena sp. SIO3I6 TaxID=2607831 RepID=UPI0013FAB351
MTKFRIGIITLNKNLPNLPISSSPHLPTLPTLTLLPTPYSLMLLNFPFSTSQKFPLLSTEARYHLTPLESHF